ncbi:MAG: M28 family metallopeptidase [Promethearchaeota archaeon]
MALDTISEQLGREGHQLIFDICNIAKYRLPGSESEKKAQEYMKGKMKEFGADEVEVNKFHTYAKFFKYWPKLSLLFYLISLFTFHFSPLLTIILIILMLGNIGLKLFSYTFFDVLFKKHMSSNIIGKIKAKNLGSSGKPKRILIIGGHIDSTYEFPLGRKYGKGMMRFYIFVFISAFIWFIINLVRLIMDIIDGHPIINIKATPDFGWYYIIILILTPFIVWIAWNVVSTLPVQGANDNLSGVAVATGVLKYFSENRLNNIELWAVSFGAEEGGMAGSKAFSKLLKTQLDNGTFPAESLWVVNFDSIAEKAPLIIATSEPLYRVKSHDPKLYNAMAKAAEQVAVEYKLKKIEGGTDSAPFTRLGIPSVGVIAAGEEGVPKNWHTREDTPEGCEVEGIINSIKVAIQFLLNIDSALQQ